MDVYGEHLCFKCVRVVSHCVVDIFEESLYFIVIRRVRLCSLQVCRYICVSDYVGGVFVSMREKI